jgi:DNA-binding PadR family transcriptional regulator
MLAKLEEMILLAVYRHGRDVTAADVQASLSEALGKEQAFGSIFTTLERLAAKRLVKWRKGEPDARRGGRAPRLYEITASGQHALRASLAASKAIAGAEAFGELAGATVGRSS